MTFCRRSARAVGDRHSSAIAGSVRAPGTQLHARRCGSVGSARDHAVAHPVVRSAIRTPRPCRARRQDRVAKLQPTKSRMRPVPRRPCLRAARERSARLGPRHTDSSLRWPVLSVAATRRVASRPPRERRARWRRRGRRATPAPRRATVRRFRLRARLQFSRTLNRRRSSSVVAAACRPARAAAATSASRRRLEADSPARRELAGEHV